MPIRHDDWDKKIPRRITNLDDAKLNEAKNNEVKYMHSLQLIIIYEQCINYEEDETLGILTDLGRKQKLRTHKSNWTWKLKNNNERSLTEDLMT